MADLNVNVSEVTTGFEDVGSSIIINGDMESVPAFIAATNTQQRWIDGTAAGSNNTTSPYYWALTTRAGTVSCQFDSSISHSGTNSLKVSTLATASFIECHQVKQDTVAGRLGHAMPVYPSTAYTGSVWIQTNYVSGDSNDGAYLVFATYNSALSLIATNITTKVKTTTSWTQYIVNFSTSSTAVFLVPQCRVYGQSGTATLIMDAWFDDILLQTNIPSGNVAVPITPIVTAGIQDISGPKIWS